MLGVLAAGAARVGGRVVVQSAHGTAHVSLGLDNVFHL